MKLPSYVIILSSILLNSCNNIPQELKGLKIVYDRYDKNKESSEILIMDCDGTINQNLVKNGNYDLYTYDNGYLYFTQFVESKGFDGLCRLNMKSKSIEEISEITCFGVSNVKDSIVIISGMYGFSAHAHPKLYIVNLKNKTKRLISKGNYGIDYRFPYLSPDGREVIIQRDDKKNYDVNLWVVDLLGNELYPITHFEYLNELMYLKLGRPEWPTWSASNKVYYIFSERDRENDLHIRSIHALTIGGNNQRITPDSLNVGLYSLSPDEKWIVFDGYKTREDSSQFYLLNLNDLTIKQITNDNQIKSHPIFIKDLAN